MARRKRRNGGASQSLGELDVLREDRRLCRHLFMGMVLVALVWLAAMDYLAWVCGLPLVGVYLFMAFNMLTSIGAMIPSLVYWVRASRRYRRRRAERREERRLVGSAFDDGEWLLSLTSI